MLKPIHVIHTFWKPLIVIPNAAEQGFHSTAVPPDQMCCNTCPIDLVSLYDMIYGGAGQHQRMEMAWLEVHYDHGPHLARQHSWHLASLFRLLAL